MKNDQIRQIELDNETLEIALETIKSLTEENERLKEAINDAVYTLERAS